MNDTRYNWAVLGCGKIAAKFAADLALLPKARLYAAASRSLENARDFAKKAGFERAYGSYEDLAADPAVDVVYVATPHAFHKEHSVLCLRKGKAVLCEKAFAINAAEARDMVRAAKDHGAFLMEAFWTRFQPSFQAALALIGSGELGALKAVRADFAFKPPYDPQGRLFDTALGGGSLLDIGIYPVFAALVTLGAPDNIRTLASFGPTGSEESILVSFGYKDGRMASLASSLAAQSPTQAEFWLEKGYLRLNRHFNGPSSLSVGKAGEEERILRFDKGAGLGYELEAAHVMDCLDAGKRESDLLPWSLSISLMETLDRIRADAGIAYPGHDRP